MSEIKESIVDNRLCVEIQCARCGKSRFKRKAFYLKSPAGPHYCSIECHNKSQQEVVYEEDLKFCKGCNKYKDINDFYFRSAGKTRRARCWRCNESKRKIHYDLEKYRKTYLLRTYGISIEDYNALFIKQNGVCAICKKSEMVIADVSKKTRNLAIDHCHKTGIVRGLLCNSCNTMLGKARESIEILSEAIKYLQQSEDIKNVA